VNLANVPNFRLAQWPGANQLYLAIRFFSACSTAIPATPGSVDVTYQNLNGGSIPLGEYLTSTAFSLNLDSILSTPITDPNVQKVGQLNFTLAAGATVGTINWQLSFANAYLLPQLDSYEEKEKHGHDHHFRDG
jgi:hypothetical protein